MAAQTVTPAERIRELSAINSDVAAMLASAGQAIHALTNRPLESFDEDTHMEDGTSNTLDAHKASFEKNTEAYFTGMQGVIARLRRQAYALEEAGIITPDSTVLGAAPSRPAAAAAAAAAAATTTTTSPTAGWQQPGVPSQPPKMESERIRNGGLGNFDVGWLNSRGNKVGEEKEAELVQEAKDLLERVLSESKG